MDFRVQLSLFRGPLDLLLYLVRKHEVDICDIPVAEITDQYLQYIAVLEQLNVDEVGDFLAMAATLIEIKSQQLLPRCDEVEEAIEDPREELVRRLLEYKQFRDAASILEERSRQFQQHFTRADSDLPRRERDLSEEPIHEVELWDLVSAFGRIIRATELIKPSSIVYDDTPIHVFMARIYRKLHERGRLGFAELFEGASHKSTLIGIFLAVLELVRHHHVVVQQSELFGEIWLRPSEDAAEQPDFSAADSYEKAAAEEKEP